MSKSFLVSSTGSAAGTVATEPVTFYTPIVGVMNTAATGTVQNYHTPIREAGVLSNLYALVIQNDIAQATSASVTLQKNDVDTTLLVTWGSSQTGLKEDITHTVTVAATDTAVLKLVATSTAGTHTATFQLTGMEFTPTNTSNCVAITANPLNGISADSQTIFLALDANGAIVTNTEANIKYRVRESFTTSNLYSYLATNTRVTDFVIKTRLNGADGTQLITYTSGQTGEKEDTTHTDSITAGDDYNLELTTSTGGGATGNGELHLTWKNTNSAFPLISGRTGGTSQAFNVTNFFPIAGSLINPLTTETNNALYPRFTFTGKELGSMVTANTIATSNTTVDLMDSGVTSGVTVSYAAAQTGLKNDSTNTTQIATTETLSYRVVTPNTSGSITLTWMSILGSTASAVAIALSPRPRNIFHR